MAYINLPVVTDTNVLVQQALNNLASNIPGWIPREGNLEVLLLEQFAIMASEAATVASNVPDVIFEYFGGLVGITPNTGANATIQTTWTLVSAAGNGGYTIPAGTIAGFFYGGAAYQFQTIADYTIPMNSTTGSIQMQAVSVGSVYNIQNLSQLNVLSTYLQLTTPNPNVVSILITATAATDPTQTLGVDAETSEQFLNRLTAELQLLAPRPITPSDFALFSQNVAGVYRALAFDGFNPFTNRLTTADANLLTAATSSSAPANWGVVGNGTATVPALSTPGTSPANYLQITSTGTALLNNVPFNAAASEGSNTIVINVGTGPTFSNSTISGTNPAFVLIKDSTNGNEIVMVTAASAKAGSGAGATQTLTIASDGTQMAHNTSATATLLQGASLPPVVSLSANADYYQAATVIEAGNATTATDEAYVVSVATYVDGSVEVFSSTNIADSSLHTYTSGTKTIVCNIESANYSSSSALAFDAAVTSTYTNLKPYIVSVQSYVLLNTTQTTKTHKVLYNSLNQVQLALTPTGSLTISSDDPTATTSSYNFIPDATFSDYLYTNGSSASWTNPAGTTILPNYGVQYLGTGSANGSNITVASQIFNLSSVPLDTMATTRQYTLFANVDASYTTNSTYSDIFVEVVDVATNTVLATLTPTQAIAGTLVSTFTLSAPKDVQVKIIFGTGLKVPPGESVIVANVGVLSGTYIVSTLPEYEQDNYFWTPGGLYDPNTFNYPRNVTVAPVDVNGLSVGPVISDTVADYLQARREVNFTVQTITPSYVPIDVQWGGYVSAGYTAADVQASANAAIREFLNPATWAGGSNTPPYWDGSQTTVRVMDIAGIIASVPGISSISSVQIRTSYPLNGSFGTSDIALNGVAPLPIANSLVGVLFTNSQNAYSGLG